LNSLSAFGGVSPRSAPVPLNSGTIFTLRVISRRDDKFFYELIITHCSKFFKKNKLGKFTALLALRSFNEGGAANSLKKKKPRQRQQLVLPSLRGYENRSTL